MSLEIFMINQITSFEVEMTLRCKHGDLAVIVGEYPGCEANIGRIVQVRGPSHLSEQCGELPHEAFYASLNRVAVRT